jgi:hypothetical protein
LGGPAFLIGGKTEIAVGDQENGFRVSFHEVKSLCNRNFAERRHEFRSF